MAGRPESNPWRFFGLGLEFAGVTLLFAFLGWYLVDRGSDRRIPWGLLTGAIIGVCGSLYNLIKLGLRANRNDPQSRDRDS